jgi:ribosomal protein S18 acetylase RimI-like enzyme
MNLHVREADFDDERDAKGILAVLDSYASAPVGGGQPLAPDVRERLIPMLREHPTSLVLLAFVDDDPVGIAVCFFGMSTFRARPLLNIHDLAVLTAYQGKGVGPALLEAVEEHARRRGCCKLTLEVQDDNTRARGVYQRFGFEDYALGPTRFLTKALDE